MNWPSTSRSMAFCRVAGHWIAEEDPEAMIRSLVSFDQRTRF